MTTETLHRMRRVILTVAIVCLAPFALYGLLAMFAKWIQYLDKWVKP